MFSVLTHCHLRCLSLLGYKIMFPKKKCENTFQTRDGFAFCYIEKNSIEGLQDKIDLGQ